MTACDTKYLYLGMYLSLMISKCELCSVSTDVLDTGNVLIDKVYSLAIYYVDERWKLLYGRALLYLFLFSMSVNFYI